jgi:hypothetical protein
MTVRILRAGQPAARGCSSLPVILSGGVDLQASFILSNSTIKTNPSVKKALCQITQMTQAAHGSMA